MSKKIIQKEGITAWTRIVKSYICNRCRTVYSNQYEARLCAARRNERTKFKKGEKVTWVSNAYCNHHNGRMRVFPINGVIVEIGKLEAVDEDYSNRHMEGKLKNAHARQFTVEFPCICEKHKKRGILLYSVEMKRRTSKLKPPRTRKK